MELQQSNELYKSLQDMGFTHDEIQASYKGTNRSSDFSVLIDWIDNFRNTQEVAQQKQQIPVQQNQQQAQQFQQQNQQEQQSEGQQEFNILDLIDKEQVKQIIDFGYKEIVAQKALILTLEHRTVESAMQWIDENKDEADFEEDLEPQVIMNIIKQFGKKTKVYTEEELKIQQEQLKERIRQNKIKKAEQAEKEKEDKQMKARDNHRKMMEMKKKQEEEELRREIEREKQKKIKDQQEKEKLIKELEEERRRKFGDKYIEQQKKQEVVISEYEKFEKACQSIITASPPNLYEGKAKLCVQTLKAYSSNLLKIPFEDKYRSIKKENAAFQQRIKDCYGGISALKFIGFVEEDQIYIYKGVINEKHVQDCIAFMDLKLKQL